jgi:hypothetical protein
MLSIMDLVEFEVLRADAKDRRGLLEGNLVRNQVCSVGVHQHVLGMTARRINTRYFI